MSLHEKEETINSSRAGDTERTRKHKEANITMANTEAAQPQIRRNTQTKEQHLTAMYGADSRSNMQNG